MQRPWFGSGAGVIEEKSKGAMTAEGGGERVGAPRVGLVVTVRTWTFSLSF